jgi:hypothetical protein
MADASTPVHDLVQAAPGQQKGDRNIVMVQHGHDAADADGDDG